MINCKLIKETKKKDEIFGFLVGISVQQIVVCMYRRMKRK